MAHLISHIFYGIAKPEEFKTGLAQVLDAVGEDGTFAGDQLLTFGRNLSFIRNPRFMAAVRANAPTPVEIACLWRTYILCWAARNALRVPGDFVETGTYRGYSAKMVCDYVAFGESGRRFFLYDLFEHDDSMPHHSLPDHGGDLYGKVVERFRAYPGVRVIKGRVPESFAQGEPEKIAFLHIDLNNAEAEVAVLERLFDRVSPGGLVIFDDYGWSAYGRQKELEDAWLAPRGYEIMELPTGQGFLIKH